MKSKFAGTCIFCRKPFPAGAEIGYEQGRGAWHPECGPKELDPDEIQLQKDIARGITPLKGSPF